MPSEGPIRKDVLGSILDPPADETPGLAGLARLTHRDPASRPLDDAPDALPVNEGGESIPPALSMQAESVASPKPNSNAMPGNRETPLQLTEATALKLEQARAELALYLPPEAGKRLSVSLVCEVALRMVLGDLGKKGEGSLLVTVLRKLLIKP